MRTFFKATNTTALASLILITIFVSVSLIFNLNNHLTTHDDAYIFFVYAKNLSQGFGPVFNIGEFVWGYTSPLFVFVLGFFNFLGLESPTISLYLNLGCNLLATFALFKVLTFYFNKSISLIAAFSVSTIVCINMPGLEASFLVMLQVFFLLAYLNKKPKTSCILASLCCLTRPDAILLVVPLLVLQTELRKFKYVFLFLTPGILWLLFSASYYGSILPSSFHAKISNTDFLHYLEASSRWYGGSKVATTALICLSLSAFFFKELRKNKTYIYVFILYPWILLFSYALIGSTLGHWWQIISGKYFLYAGAVVVSSKLLEELAKKVLPTSEPKNKYILRTIYLSLLLIVSHQLFCSLCEIGKPNNKFWLNERYAAYRTISQWLNINTPSASSIYAYEPGTLKYFSQNKILIDGLGLVSPIWKNGKRMSFKKVIEVHVPDYILLAEPYESLSSNLGKYQVMKKFEFERFSNQVILSKIKDPRIIYVPIGDSYTIGEGILENQRWPNLLVNKLKKKDIKIELVANPAKSGWTTKEALEYEVSILKENKATFSTLLIGVNDWVQGATESDFKNNLSILINAIQENLENNNCLVLITIPDFSLTPNGKLYTRNRDATKGIESFNRIIKEEGNKRDLNIADVFEISSLVKGDLSLVAADGLHPSAKQYELWADEILKATDKTISKNYCFDKK